MVLSFGGRKSYRAGVLGVLVCAMAAIVVSGTGAYAAGVPLTGWIVKVSADKPSMGLHDEYVTYFAAGETMPPSGEYDWSLPSPFVFADGLGQLTSLNLTLATDPSVSLGFSVLAGAAGADFTVSSAVFTYGPFTNPDAYASAAVTVTDGEPFDTATLLGLFPDNKVFQAKYNGGVWKSLVTTPPTTGTGGTETSEEVYPPVALFETIPGTVTSISSEFKFRLTPLDQGSGTSFFYVTPEPATVALLGIGLAWAWRRRQTA